VEIKSIALRSCRVVAGSDSDLLVWDLTERRILHTLDEDLFVNCVAVLPLGRIVSGAGGSPNDHWDEDTERYYRSELIVWGADDGRRLQSLDGHYGPVNCVALLPDGRLTSGAGYPENSFRVWDLADGRCLQILPEHNGYVTCVAVLPTGRIISGDIGARNALKVWAERDREIEKQVVCEVSRQRAHDDVGTEIAKFI